MRGANRPVDSEHRLTLQPLAGQYAICRLPEGADTGFAGGELVAVMRAAGETQPVTVICDETSVSGDIECDTGWRAIRIVGIFDFGEVGVLKAVLDVLDDARVPALTVATYETDYVLVKAERFDRVCQALEEAGHQVVDDAD